MRAARQTVLRKVGVIHGDHRYDVTLRNLLRTGCLIEGLLNLPRFGQFGAMARKSLGARIR